MSSPEPHPKQSRRKWLTRLATVLFVWAFLCLLDLLGYRGPSVTSLIEYSHYADPPITQIHAAYARDHAVIVDYSVAGRVEQDYSIPPGRYWAQFSPADRDRPMGQQYSFHRSPLQPADVAGWTPIPVIDFAQHIQRAADGHYKFDDSDAYLATIPDDQLPAVVFLVEPLLGSGAPQLNTNFFRILYRDPATNARQRLDQSPYTTYIPPQNRTRIALLYPFSVLRDWLIRIEWWVLRLIFAFRQ